MLTTPQVRFTLDSETSDPTDVGVYEHKEANSTGEGFLLNPKPNASPSLNATPSPHPHPHPKPKP